MVRPFQVDNDCRVCAVLTVLSALAPDFILLALGRTLSRILSADVWRGIDQLNFRLLFPALIFIAALNTAPSGNDLLVIGLGTWVIMALACLMAWVFRRLGPDCFLDFASLWQTAWRFNTALALVVAQALPAQYQGYFSIAIGMAVPVANVMAVSALSRGGGKDTWQTVRQIAVNPFLVASSLGILCSIFDVNVPGLLTIALAKLSQAAVPVALLSIGAALTPAGLVRLDAFAVVLNAIKLIIGPMIALAGCYIFGLDAGHRAVLTLFAALPTASAAHVLASAYGGDREAVALVIAQSTLLGCLTLPFWLMIVAPSTIP